MSAQGETADLFDEGAEAKTEHETLAEGALLLRRFVGDEDAALMASLHTIITQAPLRQMLTRGGFRMSVAMSNCGGVGWISDRRGYRYDAIDPQTGRPWPAMPAAFTALASGLGIMVPAGTLWYIVPAVVSVAALPVTPSGLGVRENLFVWLLTVPALGVKPGAALSLSLLGYTVNLAWSAVGGIVYLLMPDRAKVAAARSRGV